MGKRRNIRRQPDSPLKDLSEVLSLLMPGGRKEAVLCSRPGQTPWIEAWLVWEADSRRPEPDRYRVAVSVFRKMAANGWLAQLSSTDDDGQRYVLNAIGQSAWWDIADELEEGPGDQERYMRLLLRRYGVRF